MLMLPYVRNTISAAVAAIALGAVPGVAAASPQSLCIGHHPQPFVWYTQSCTGHDEPEIDPLSSATGSAQDLTWTVVLPADGTVPVDAVGPSFWIGGVVTDPNSLFGQAFLELQFYPNSMVKGCASGGGYNVVPAPGEYTACAPVWSVSKKGNAESAAFNAMLVDNATGGALVMHAGDTITDHQYVTPARDGMHVTVTDLTTGHSGTIVLDAKVDGPLMPAFNQQEIGNTLGWGLVHDAPNALVWEIGHTSNFTKPAGQICYPGQATKPPCYSYDASTWLGFSPLQVKGVSFGNGGGTASSWAVVSDFGGAAEVNQYCGAANYGSPFCSYPWFAYNGTDRAFTFGADYAGTTNDFQQAQQYTQQQNCVSPNGPYPQYCSTVIAP
jgi:hypothetical protein